MRASRAALGRNPLQHGLMDSASMPIFGEPVAQQDKPHIAGEQSRVESLMADGFWHTIPHMQKELRRLFSQLYSETSISARIRGMRRRGWLIESKRSGPDSGLYLYRAARDEAWQQAHAHRASDYNEVAL